MSARKATVLRVLAAVLFTGLLATGCTLLTSFDQNTQACDEKAPAGQQCLPGHSCVSGICRAGDGGFVDAGS